MLNITEPIKFQPAFLTFDLLCFILYIIVFVFTYSFLNNARMKVYNKLNYSSIMYVVLGTVILLFITLASIITGLHFGNDDLFINNKYIVPLSWILVFLALSHLILMIIARIYINKNKKEIANFREENFQKLLVELETNKPKEIFLKHFQTKNARYISNLNHHKELIELSFKKYTKENYAQTLLNIIVFNDNYTTKWSKKTNYFQLKMFYEICIEFQKKQK